jgi:hypothetical protein
MKTFAFVAAVLAVALAGPAFAGSCPKEMAAIDAALAKNPKLSANDMAAVKKARADGEAHHKAGKHAESIAELNKAKKALGL